MDIKLPPIAPKEEIRRFLSNIDLFKVQSEYFRISKDIYAPSQYTAKIISSPESPTEKESPIMKLKSIPSLISFFNQMQILKGQEISINQIEDIIDIISTGPFGLKVCFSIYIRSLSLLINYLLSKEVPGTDRINKNLTQKAIDSINSLPIQSSFYPELNQHPIIDFEIPNYRLSSPTSICVSIDSIFACSESGIVTRYDKNGFRSVSRDFLSLPANFGTCSMMCLGEKFYFISNSQKCLIINFDGNVVSSTISPNSSISYPSISDGFYIYSIVFDKRAPQVRVFNQKLEKVRNPVKLILPDSLFVTNSMPVSTNGTFLNFIENDKCHIFSILTGRYICTQKVQQSLLSITYDFTFNGFLCFSFDGLVEIAAKSTAPPWQLNYQGRKSDNNSPRESLLESLALLAIHYVGSGSDFPLSFVDDSCLNSLSSLLASLMDSKESQVNENGLIGVLFILQVKMRRFCQLPAEIDQKLIEIFSEDRFIFARRCAAFLFLSCLSLFEKSWNKNCTKILKLIVDDTNCSDFVFSFLSLFSFDVPDLDENVLKSILNLMQNSSENQRFKSLIILSTIQDMLIKKLPESESLFTSYVTHLMLKTTESWTSYLSSGNGKILSATCFIVVKVLEMQIMKNINRINLPLIVTERLFAVSIMQPMGNENDEQGLKTQQIFNCLLFFALHFAFKKMETTEFVVFSEKVERNHPQISVDEFLETVDDSNRQKELELLVKCANDSNWSDKSEVIDFLNAMKGKISNLKELEKQIDQLHSIQPQPLRKIQHFFATGEFKVIGHQDSAIYQLMNYAQWIPNSFNRLIFACFLSKIDQFQDDFLCIPRKIVKQFVQSSAVTILLPLSVIKFSKVKLKESLMEFRDMQCSYDKISAYIMKEQSDEFIKPLLSLKTNTTANARNVHRAIISAIIGFRKSDIKTVNDEIIEKLVYCRKAVNSDKMVKLLVELVRIFALRGDVKIFDFIVEIIGGCILKRGDIFPNAKNNRSMFQFAFEFVELSRELVTSSNEFRLFLSSSEFFGATSGEESSDSHSALNENDIHVIKKLAFMVIINNDFSFPVVGCSFTAVSNKKEKVNSRITKISKNGHKISLEDGKTYDIRNLMNYNTKSKYHIDSEVFTDEQIDRIVDFFNAFHKFFKLSPSSASKIINSELALNLRPLISILYFTSLQCLSFNTKFVSKFHGIYQLSPMMAAGENKGEIIEGDELIVVEPINDKTVFRRFWEFYTKPSTADFSVFESDGGFATSPISPTAHFSVRFHFSGMCEATLYCCFSSASSLCVTSTFSEVNDQALVYQTVTFPDYFDFVFDSDSQQASLISPYNTVSFPIFNSALFYSIFIKTEKVTFEVKNEQWTLDKLNSYESYDFTSFKICSLRHVSCIPCKSFEDSFLNELGIIIRNMCMKTIVPNMARVKPINAALCVSFFSSVLSNFKELFKSSATKLKTRIRGSIDLDNAHYDLMTMTDIFLMYCRNALRNALTYIIWRNNAYARPAKKGTVVSNCVVLALGVIKEVEEETAVEFDCFVLPKEHLNRTAIELIMFCKNALVFCKETRNEKAFAEVVEIMRKCREERIPGFTESDLKDVETVIKEVEEMFEE